MPAPVRVLLVDDHEVFVDALALCLGDYPDLEVQGSATTVAQGLRMLRELSCDVVVLDLALAGEDGLALAREALSEDPTLGIVVATGADAGDQIVEAVQLGVRGWVTKTETADSLVDAIRGVARGETRIPADLLAEVLVSLSRGQHSAVEHVQGIQELTGRELEVLACLVEGMSRTEIGLLLHVSPNTVRTHVQSILHKLKVHSALAAVAIARRAGVTGATVPAG
ncbi:DNA-binding response regulator, NarL/FixJ family, contains REC and HTH domains [Pedococcus dokdonensis]|uniref:DNA-binding response regulator, NarL/FixJ family, contains REC and HTH domains n=1 Tax=Pedococcus dokdonensis TaxID=443156 RepID=A0A1H0P7I5_9MICO|nr:response regulator transcription factor [Pedococcus dokdonensis]SDP01002.1 DNA-binding response regulator, NarL/FixJ family, contains REC and HTH domains [Pedococcus dokdonensis]